jgi:hypothetical protein
MTSKTFFLCGGLLVTVGLQAQNPGDIGTANLMFWLRGDLGVTAGATFTWADQSGNNRFVSQATAADQPVVTTATADYMNYNPGVKIVADEWLIMNGGLNAAGTTANEIYLVYKKATGSADGMVIGTNVPGNRSYFYGSGVVQYGNSGKPVTIAPGYVTNGANIFVGKFFSASDAAQAANGAVFSALTPVNPPATFTTPVAVGAQPSNSGGYNAFGYTGNVMELVGYNAEIDLTGTQRQQVESYLALKYGITLDSVGSGGYYYNSAGSSVYQGGGGSGYFTNIIGIARDDNTALYQRQSHLANDSVRLYLGGTPLATATNGANTATFGADRSYIVMGDNAGNFCGSGNNVTAKPATVDERLDREWKVVYNHTSDAFNMDITLASCAPFSSGTGNPADLELLYSTTSANLTAGSIMANNTNGMTITLSAAGVVTIAGLNSVLAAIAPATPGGTTVYFTLASNHFEVLPLVFTTFTAIAAGRAVQLNWTAPDEPGEGYFQIMHSADGNTWDTIGRVDAATGVTDHSFNDGLPYNGVNYYRLQLVRSTGNSTWSPVREVVFPGGLSSSIQVFPNPATDQVYIMAPGLNLDGSVIQLYALSGVALPVRVTGGTGLATMQFTGLPAGLYLLRVKTSGGWQIFRIVRH